VLSGQDPIVTGVRTIAAVIPTKNVARIIRPTLESLRFCDEVIIVDMFSSDDTRAVCEEFPNVRFFERRDYIYGNFNFGLEQAQSEWIVRIDSDEVLGPTLIQSIKSVLSEPQPAFTHYEAFCHLYICGIRLHGGYGASWRTTLFRRGTARYQVRGEHEGLSTTGAGGRLDGHYDHFSVPTLSDWMLKYNYYTDRDVERAPARPPKAWWRVLWGAVRHFRGSYFGAGKLRRDGYLGFVVAVLAAFANVLLEMKIWERWERERLRAAGMLPNHPNASPAESSASVSSGGA
jgi:glycosyltransferase involved in cell wall biosynthesis